MYTKLMFPSPTSLTCREANLVIKEATTHIDQPPNLPFHSCEDSCSHGLCRVLLLCLITTPSDISGKASPCLPLGLCVHRPHTLAEVWALCQVVLDRLQVERVEARDGAPDLGGGCAPVGVGQRACPAQEARNVKAMARGLGHQAPLGDDARDETRGRDIEGGVPNLQTKVSLCEIRDATCGHHTFTCSYGALLGQAFRRLGVLCEAESPLRTGKAVGHPH